MTLDFVSSLKLFKCQLSAMLIDDIIVSSRSIVLNWLDNLELFVIYANHDTIIINNIMPIDSTHDDRLVGCTTSSIDTITARSGCGSGSPIDGRTTWNCSVLVDTIMCEASSLSSASSSSSVVASEVEMKPLSTMKPSPLSSLSTNIVLFSITLLGHLLSISQQLLLYSDNTSIDDTHHHYQHSGDDIEYATTATAGEGDHILHKVISIVYHALEHPDARVREQISVIIRILYSSRSFDLNLNNPNTELLILSNLNNPNTEFLSNLNNPNTTEFLSNLHDYIVAHIQSHWCRSVIMRETSLGDESEIAMDDTTGNDDSGDDHHYYHHLSQQSNLLVIFTCIVIHPPVFASIYPTSSIHNLSVSSHSCLSTPLSSLSPSLSSIGWHYLESYLKALYSLLLGLLPIEHCMPYLLYHTIDMPRDMSSSMLSHALPMGGEHRSMMMMMMMMSRLTTIAEHDSNHNKDNIAIHNSSNDDDDDDEIIVASNINTLQLRSSELLIYCTSLHVNRHVREGMLSALYHYHPSSSSSLSSYSYTYSSSSSS